MHLSIYRICPYIGGSSRALRARMTPCTRCGGETRTFVCLGCGEAHYCSRRCQKRDWPRHKQLCLLSERAVARHEASGSSAPMPGLMELASQAREEALGYLEVRLRTCAVCSKVDFRMQKCGRCKSTHYCSSSCQSKDWPVHKLSCRPDGNA